MPTPLESRVRAKDERLQAHRQDDGSYIVYNPSSGSKYAVIQATSGTWYCTCPFATKSSRPSELNPCKHLQRVLDKEAGCTSCHKKDVPLKDGKCTECRFYDRMGL
jgi:hypothetical protein